MTSESVLSDAARASSPSYPFSALDQTPGQSGLTDDSDAVVWRCLILGCGASTCKSDPICGCCQSPRPSDVMVRRSKVHQQAISDRIATEKQAIVDMYEQRLNSMRIQIEASRMTHDKGPDQTTLLSQLTVLQEEKQVLLSALVAAGREKDIVEKRCEAAVIATREDARRETERAEELQRALTIQQEAVLTARSELAQMRSSLALLQVDEQDESSKVTANLQLESEHNTTQARETKVAQFLKQLNLLDVATNGDAMILQELNSMGALGFLTDIINEFHLFELVAKTNCMNMTVLMIACFQGHTTVAELLLKIPGIDVNVRDTEEGVSALMWASHNGHTAVVQALLLDSRLAVNAHDKSGLTALLYAGSGGHTGTVQALVADGRVELNTQEKDGWSALIFASHGGHAAMVQALLGASGRVKTNLQDERGWTALMHASRNGHIAVVQVLLACRKVKLNVKNKSGKTALYYAWKSDEIKTMLQSAGAVL